MRSPRARTEEELREALLDHLVALANYWSRARRPPEVPGPEDLGARERILGFAHSLLTTLCGRSGGFPCSLDLVTSPHPDDEEFYRSEGEDWVPTGDDGNLDWRLYWRPDGSRRPGTEDA